jgi:hypothetical protein
MAIHGGEQTVGNRSTFLPPAGNVRERRRPDFYEPPEQAKRTRWISAVDDMLTMDAPFDEDNGEPEKCPICFEEFNVGEQVKWTDCNHAFHDVCLTEWDKHAHTCPICKKDFQPGFRK